MSISPVRFGADTRIRLDEIRAPMSAYAKTAIAAAVGVALGLAATYFATLGDFPFGAARTGAWTVWPKAGAFDADPYTRAIVARKADSPLGNGEGLVFVAREDSDGAALDGACEYRVEGAMPVARMWTLSAYTPDGRLLRSDDGHGSASSAGVVRMAGGDTEIVVSPGARPGNWISVAPGRPFALALTLYDAAASPTITSLEGLAMPKIRKVACS